MLPVFLLWLFEVCFVLDTLLGSLSVVERSVVQALVSDGATLSCDQHTLILAYPAFCEQGEPFYKRYERLPSGQWQQVLCVNTGNGMVYSVTPFDLEG